MLLKIVKTLKFSKALKAHIEHLTRHANGTRALALAICSTGVTVPNRDASVPLLAWSYDETEWVKEITILLSSVLFSLKAEAVSPMSCLTCNYPLSVLELRISVLFSQQSPSACDHCYLRTKEEDFFFSSCTFGDGKYIFIFFLMLPVLKSPPELSFYGHTKTIIFFV